jgi:hypothetical protein
MHLVGFHYENIRVLDSFLFMVTMQISEEQREITLS